MIPLYEKIRSVPAFKSTVFFSAGIICEEFFAKDLIPLTIIWWTFSVILLVMVFYIIFLSSNLNLFPASLIYIFFSFAGFGISCLENNSIPLTGKGIYLAEVVSLPEKKEKSTLIRLKLRGGHTWENVSCKKQFVNAYFTSLDSAKLPKPGETIIFQAVLNAINNSGNPYEFDYSRYLSRKNIYTNCFLSENSWKQLPGNGRVKNLHSFSLSVKEGLIDYIREISRKKGGLNYEVLLAICTGDKSEITQDIKTSYSNAGAIHVMAVSGLHVGMIWAFFGYLTFFLKGSKTGRFIQFLLVLGILWFYAFLTGLSPSVVRSCTMFTIASIANFLKRNKGIYNSVFIAALIQLSLNPQLLFDAGFQFSYTAVLSILLFQPVFRGMVSSRNLILKRLNDLVSVSISAQILTFPLAVYYFHQFPVYFLLTNICIIPLVTILLMGFILSVIFIPFPIISQNLLFISLQITKFMTDCVILINNIPGSVIGNLTINVLQLIFYMFSALLLLRFILIRKFAILSSALIILGIIIWIGSYQYKVNNKDSVAVYNIRGSAAIEIHHGKSHFLLYNDSTLREKDIEYAAGGYRIYKHYGKPKEIMFSAPDLMIDSIYFFKLPGYGNLIYNYGKIRIAILSDYSLLQTYEVNESLCVEALILAGNKIPDFVLLLKYFNPRWFIVSSSVPVYIPDPDSILLHTHYHRISKHGAFVLDI